MWLCIVLHLCSTGTLELDPATTLTPLLSSRPFLNNNNNNNNIYLLQLGFYPVAVVILLVNKT